MAWNTAAQAQGRSSSMDDFFPDTLQQTLSQIVISGNHDTFMDPKLNKGYSQIVRCSLFSSFYTIGKVQWQQTSNTALQCNLFKPGKQNYPGTSF